MLVRESGDRRLQVLLLRRSQASHFVPDAYVFPGGTVDAADEAGQTAGRVRGLDAARLQRQFRMAEAPAPQEQAALFVAALRELYEEAGILLARDARGAALGALEHSAQRGGYVDRLVELDAYGDGEALALFSHWITPPVFPKRYNTFFFAAQAPPDQRALADAVETHDGIWIAAAEALERSREGTLHLVFPTIKHLERLAQFHDARSFLDYANEKPIVTVMPDVPGHMQFALPDTLESAW